MKIEVPTTADPSGRLVVSTPDAVLAECESMMPFESPYEVALPEGVHEEHVEVTFVGLGNNGQPTGNPVVIKHRAHKHDPHAAEKAAAKAEAEKAASEAAAAEAEAAKPAEPEAVEAPVEPAAEPAAEQAIETHSESEAAVEHKPARDPWHKNNHRSK